MVCDCFLTEEEIERGELGCGEDCLNRLLMIEWYTIYHIIYIIIILYISLYISYIYNVSFHNIYHINHHIDI